MRRLGIEYFHERFGERNRIERWFRELKKRIRKFYDNVNSKNVKSVEELVKAIALLHNLTLLNNTRRGVIPTDSIKKVK